MATRRGVAGRGLVWSVCLLHLLPSVRGQCASFEFPGATTPSSGNCTVEVPLPNPLPFSLNSHNCSRGQQSFNIIVSIHGNNNTQHRQVCQLRITEGKCRNPGGSCLCGQSKGRYYLKEELSNGTLLTLRANVDFVKGARVCIRGQETEPSSSWTSTTSDPTSSFGSAHSAVDSSSNDDDDNGHSVSSLRSVFIGVVSVAGVLAVMLLVVAVLKWRRGRPAKVTRRHAQPDRRTYFREVRGVVSARFTTTFDAVLPQ